MVKRETDKEREGGNKQKTKTRKSERVLDLETRGFKRENTKQRAKATDRVRERERAAGTFVYIYRRRCRNRRDKNKTC